MIDETDGLFLGLCRAIAHLPSACQARSVSITSGHLGGFHGESAVHAAIGAVEGEVFFNNGGAQCHAGYRHANAHSVIGQAHLAAEQFAQVRDGQDVDVFGRGRVGAGALEQDQVFAARLTCSANGFIQLCYSGHAGRDNERLARGGHAADQRQVSILE